MVGVSLLLPSDVCLWLETPPTQTVALVTWVAFSVASRPGEVVGSNLLETRPASLATVKTLETAVRLVTSSFFLGTSAACSPVLILEIFTRTPSRIAGFKSYYLCQFKKVDSHGSQTKINQLTILPTFH